MIVDYIDKFLKYYIFVISAEQTPSSNETEQSSFLCDQCSFNTLERQKLQKHIRDIHNKDKACPICDYQTSRNHRMKMHIWRMHPEDTIAKKNLLSLFNGNEKHMNDFFVKFKRSHCKKRFKCKHHERCIEQIEEQNGEKLTYFKSFFIYFHLLISYLLSYFLSFIPCLVMLIPVPCMVLNFGKN